MPRWGRTATALGAAILVGTMVTGCVGPFKTQDVVVAPPGVAADCVVGAWKQTEGWQRLRFDNGDFTELRLTTGGISLAIGADGSMKSTIAADTTWHGTDRATNAEITVTYSGTATATYSAVNGDWRQVSDLTKRVTTIRSGNATRTVPGGTGVIFEGTFLCGEDDLVLASEDTRGVYTRTS